jgi:hypothetical protein
MKKLIYLTVILGLITFSCSDDRDPSCEGTNALNLPWLTNLIEQEEQYEIGRQYSYLNTGIYMSSSMNPPKRIFFFGNCCPNCSMVPPMAYDCDGNELGRVGSEGIHLDKIKDLEVIWRSSDNDCNI